MSRFSKETTTGPLDRPTTPAEDETDLQLALELSKQSYEEEEDMRRKRRESMNLMTNLYRSTSSDAVCGPTTKNGEITPTNEVNLIDFEDPQERTRKKQIDEIKEVMKINPVFAMDSNGYKSSFGEIPRNTSMPSFAPVAPVPLQHSQTIHRMPAQTSIESIERLPAFYDYSVPRPVYPVLPPLHSNFVPPAPGFVPPPIGFITDDDTPSVVSRRQTMESILNVPFQPNSFRFFDGNLISFVDNEHNLSPGLYPCLEDFDPLVVKSKILEAADATANDDFNKADESAFLAMKPPPKPPRKSESVKRPSSSSSADVNNETERQKPKRLSAPPRPPSPKKLTMRKSKMSVEDLILVDCLSDLQKQISNRRPLSSLASKSPWSQMLISPSVAFPLSTSSVKVVIVREPIVGNKASKGGLDRVTFTCDLSSTVIHVLSNALASMNNNDGDSLAIDSCALKVHGLDEFLLPESALGTYGFVRNCLAFGRDIQLEITYIPKICGVVPTGTVVPSCSDLSPCISKDDLETVLETVKKQIEKLLKSCRTDGSSVESHFRPVWQSIKALCLKLGKVQSPLLSQALTKLRNALERENEDERNSPQNNRNDFEISVEMALSDLLRAVHRLLNAYCTSTSAEYGMAPILEKHTSLEKKEIGAMEDKLIVQMESVHYLKDYFDNFERFSVACHVFYGASELCSARRIEVGGSNLRKPSASMFPYLHIDVQVVFDIPICILPRDSRLCFVVYGHRPDVAVTSPVEPVRNGDWQTTATQIGWTSYPIFDHQGCMMHGSLAVPLCLDCEVVQPWGPRPLLGQFGEAPFILVTMPEFDFKVVFPLVPTAEGRMSRNFDTLDDETQEYLREIIDSGQLHELQPDEKDLLWEKRLYLRCFPEALAFVLSSAVSWDWACLANIYQLLDEWTPLTPVQAMELLLPQFPDCRVRRAAVDWIKEAPIDSLYTFLPQLVEALRFETFEHSALADSLLSLSSSNRRFAFECYWQLEQRKRQMSPYGSRCALLQRELVLLLGDDFTKEVNLQHQLLAKLDKVAEETKKLKEASSRMKNLRTAMELLDGSLLQTHVRLPLFPAFTAAGVQVKRCSYYNSFTLPLKVNFHGIGSDFGILHKLGDDLRQDTLVLQLIRLMNDIWLEEGVDLRMIIFHCLPTGEKRGMLELVLDCQTLREISGAFGCFNDQVIQKWLQTQNNNPFDYETALKNFRLSCAGWCVGTYLLGIGDRHNDNILLTSHGHVFHIDFGKFLGDWQMAGAIRRDRVPFVLTSEMVYVINEGAGQTTAHFQDFVDTCCQAFILLRKRNTLFLNLMKLMVCSGIPGLNLEAVKFVENNLMLGLSENQAVQQFSRLIDESMKSIFPKMNFFIHGLAQAKAGSSNEDDPGRLSFVPQIYSAITDGKIKRVQVIRCEKWREHGVKIYMYKIFAERVNERVPTYIYRSYKQFCEFNLKLCQLYPLAKLRTLPRGYNIGRSNVRDVAERRKVSIGLFLHSLFTLSDQIAHVCLSDDMYPVFLALCDLVYTFFHLLYQDQRDDMNAERELPPAPTGVISGDVKLSLEYKMGRLEIMVNHARNLTQLPGGFLPDAYVKCYLKPDPARKTKRKTRIVRRTQNPTYNEMLFWPIPSEYLSKLEVEVTVWHYDALKENSFIGGSLISLNRLTSENNYRLSGWFQLADILHRSGHELS